jgi:hypothetical protein
MLLHLLSIMVTTCIWISTLQNNQIYWKFRMPRNMPQNNSKFTYWFKLRWASLKPDNRKMQTDIITWHLPIRWEIQSNSMPETSSLVTLQSNWTTSNWALFVFLFLLENMLATYSSPEQCEFTMFSTLTSWNSQPMTPFLANKSFTHYQSKLMDNKNEKSQRYWMYRSFEGGCNISYGGQAMMPLHGKLQNQWMDFT